MSGRTNLFKSKPRAKKRENVSPRLLNYQKQASQYQVGTIGPAGPCKRICPQTGEVIEIIDAKPVDPRPRQPPGYEHYTPEFVQAIRDTCSTQATRAGQTQDEVFRGAQDDTRS